jgi:alpha-galactosidase
VEATDGADVLKEIRRRGFEPAIWVAPFIAQANSHVFQRHPDWFIKRADGTPLPSSEVTFGGWRFEPWYAVDGTHPETQKHLESLFRTMRREWGCTYFKLDANFWGAMQGGRREQLSPGLQSSHLAVAGIDRWLAQLR